MLMSLLQMNKPTEDKRWCQLLRIINNHGDLNDSGDFAEFYLSYNTELLRHARTLLRKYKFNTRIYDPEDLVDEAFESFLVRRPSDDEHFGSISDVKGFLYKILLNTILQILRSKGNIIEEQIDETLLKSRIAQNDDMDRIFGFTRIFEELYKKVNRECYKLLKLIIIEGFRYKDLSHHYPGMHENTIAQKKTRCLTGFRKYLITNCLL